MSARGVLTVVGQAVGYYFGGPLGAVAGSFIGGEIGGAIDGPVESSDPIGNLASPKVEYGGRLPRIYGRHRVAGYLAWASEKRATAIETEQGKGGPSATHTSYTYSQDQLWILAIDSPIIGVSRVWRNKELIWTALAESDAEALSASANTNAWAELTFFDGNPTQMPWDVYEAAVGANYAVAYRHRASIGITDAQFVNGETPPLYEFEVYSAGDLTPGTVASWNPDDKDPNFTLTNSNMTATNATANYAGVRATIGVTTGKWYWECTIAQLDSPFDAWIGVVGGVDGLSNVIGSYHPRAMVRSSGEISQEGGADHAIGLTYGLGDTVMIAFDADTSYIWAGVNGIWYDGGDPGSGVMPTGNAGSSMDDPNFYPWAGTDNVAGSTGITANFGPTFTYPIPSGFQPISGQPASVSIENVDLADIVEAEILRAGVTEYDVSELVGTEVIGIAAAGAPRQCIEQLQAIYWFDFAPGLKAVNRGGASARSIAFIDTGAGSDQAGEPFSGVERANDTELPAQIALNGPNVLADYEAGSQMSDRLVGSGVDIRKVETSVVLTPAMQKGRAESMVMEARVSSHAGVFAVSDEHIEVEPTDVVTVFDREGNGYRLRVTRQTYADGVWSNEGVLDDPSVLIESGITSENYTPSITVRPVPGTALTLLDIPILRDADNTPGIYAAGDGTGNWPGYSLRRSSDGVDFSNEVARSTTDAITGNSTTELGDWTGGYVIDRTNTVTVSVTGELSSTTLEAFQLNNSVNAVAIGDDGRWELLNFLNATLVGTGVYTLSNLVRGRRGTEWAMGLHESGDKVVMLNSAIRRVEHNVTDIGITRYWRALTLGQSVAQASQQSFADRGMGLECFSPVRLEAERVADDITLTWTRRPRLAVRYGGPGGTYAPLGEATEAYEIDVMDGPDVVRTIAASSETAEYSAAEQTTDFGSPQAEVTFRVYQLSAIVGRGTPLEETV